MKVVEYSKQLEITQSPPLYTSEENFTPLQKKLFWEGEESTRRILTGTYMVKNISNMDVFGNEAIKTEVCKHISRDIFNCRNTRTLSTDLLASSLKSGNK